MIIINQPGSIALIFTNIIYKKYKQMYFISKTQYLREPKRILRET